MNASRIEVWSRSLAATLGTLPVVLLASAALARFLPVSADARYALAFISVIPFWVLAMCVAFLAQRSVRVWLVCAALALALGALVYGVPPRA